MHTHTCSNTGTRMKATSACQRHVQCSINNFVHTLSHIHTHILTLSLTHAHTYSYSHVPCLWIVDAGLTGGISFCAHTFLYPIVQPRVQNIFVFFFGHQQSRHKSAILIHGHTHTRAYYHIYIYANKKRRVHVAYTQCPKTIDGAKFTHSCCRSRCRCCCCRWCCHCCCCCRVSFCIRTQGYWMLS